TNPLQTNTDTSTSTTLSTQVSTTTSIPTSTSTTPLTSTTSTSTSIPTTTSSTPLPTTSSSSSSSLADILITVTQTSTHSNTSVAPTSSSTQAPSNSSDTDTSTSSGVKIGGIIAAVFAGAGILFAIVYFLRRSRSREEDDAADFDPDAFRRQSTMLPGGDGTSGIGRDMSYNSRGARPPTMIEQKLANGPGSYAPPQPYGYGAYGQVSFEPGQVYTPTTANSANPFFTGYNEFDHQYDPYGNMVTRQPSNGSSAVLSRHTSSSSKPMPELPTNSTYADMSRGSVTPFQATQYAEISRQLNSSPPHALPLGAVYEEPEYDHTAPIPVPKETVPLDFGAQHAIFNTAQHLNVRGAPTPHENSFPESPFADPTMAAEQAQYIPSRPSEDSMIQPPAPAFANNEKERITSIPPMLPEIHIQQRFSNIDSGFPAVPSSVRPSPSPFSTEFANIPATPPTAQVTPAAPAAVATRGTAGRAQRPDTVYTMYDDEDAYSGM
ncbi:uncharacterized protein BXZ73DRAFT_44129, partial [Epithele typhae]|uniref:uncharacterized protein n=1 Tax=Epithele typhae TaxID=378194 RepID=UPI002007F57C